MPITAEKIKPVSIKRVVIRNWKTISENVMKFAVPVEIPFIGNAIKQPRTPPIKASSNSCNTKRRS